VSGRSKDPFQVRPSGERKRAPDKGPGLVRYEEELVVTTEQVDAGRVYARKTVEAYDVDETVERYYERAEIEYVPANEDDSLEVEELPDGSLSIPILEEQLVVSKRIVARERVILHRRVESEDARIEGQLLRERVEVTADPGVDLREEGEASPRGNLN
jgi:uncharacterized protein (TIGR02271 family)